MSSVLLRDPAAPIAADQLSVRPEVSLSDLSAPQKLAMMQMSDQLRHQAIWHELRQQYSEPPFTLSTFIELRDLGLAYKPQERKFHALTTPGLMLAYEIGDDLQQRHHIHASYLLGRAGANVTLMCTCKWSRSLRAGDGMQLKAARAMTAHLKTVVAANDLATALSPTHLG
jgi:hypothetical protein